MSQQGMSAYQPENEMAQPPALPSKRSKVPQVLGILHLCFGGLALLTTGASVFQNKKMSEELGVQFGAIDGEGIHFPAEMIDQLAVIDGPMMLGGYLDLLISVLMVAAGIALVKYKKAGRPLTNAYAVGSLGAKALSAYVWCVLATPFFESFIEANPDFAMIGVGGFQAVMVFSLLISSVYPLVCLVLVNRKAVVDSLE
jgi:hypothetical protein